MSSPMPDADFSDLPDPASPADSPLDPDNIATQRDLTRHPLAQTILAHVGRPEYRPVKPKVIVKQLDLSVDDGVLLKRIIKRLVKQGKLAWGNKHHVVPLATGIAAQPVNNHLPTTGSSAKLPRNDFAPLADDSTPAENSSSGTPKKTVLGGNKISGTFRRTQAGHGFVRPDGLPPGSDRSLDIFIPSDAAGDAASGDKVIVKVSKRPRPGRDNQAGEILEIIERETHRFVGTYFVAGEEAFVRIDGTLFPHPILVGDPGAKNAQENDKVVIEMVRFPGPYHDGEGVIVQVLGQRGDVGIETLSIIHEYDLPQEFPEDTLEAARTVAESFDESITGIRRDLTGETVITIDPVDARDFDDAISLARDERGHWRLGVHIADVSHFVPVKTALDREAYERATSCYLPDRVIPMLPEVISNNLASLQPHKVRYTQTVYIDFSPEGVVTHVEPCLGAIKSSRRFTYEEVDEYLADRDDWQGKLTPQVHKLLGQMHELAMMLRRRRFKRGALELSMSEVKVDLDREGRVSGAHVVQNTESHQIIEEFMLAANEAIAQFLFEREIPFLRRVHGTPDPRKLKLLTEFVNELGIEAQSLESRFELQRVLAAVADKPERYAVNYAVLRSLQRAVYSPIEEGHYALASDCYCHFTSPIRRYPDLTVHRLIRTILEGGKPVKDVAALALVGEHCSERERRAEAAERELTKVKLLMFMESRVGTELDAIITGVEEFGIFAQGIDIPAEGMIHISALADDYYTFDRASHTLAGRRAGNIFRLGDKIRVTVARADLERRELDFRITSKLASGGLDVTIAPDRRSRRAGDARGGGRSGGNSRSAERGRSTGQTKSKRPIREEGGRKSAKGKSSPKPTKKRRKK
ncbi:MAG: ribonuclease R [Pirellulales bacterium]|nr:ribonuclease R [Pirellulales bacterium]